MRLLVAAALVVVTAFGTLGYAQTRNTKADDNRRAGDEIKRAEREWLIDPYFTSDMKLFDRIVADDFTITHSNGDVLSKPAKRENILASRITNPSSPFRIGEQTVRVYGHAAVSVGFIIEEKSTVRFTNTYIKSNGQWHVVASHLNRIRQP